MVELKPEYNDREILESVAEVEAEERPFEYGTAGVEGEDIVDRFGFEDFDTPPWIMIPNRLRWLAEGGYLTQVRAPGGAANAAYRLTNHGWNIVDVQEPTGPVEEPDS